MADLPSDRVNVSRVFTKVGIDYASPFFIKLYPGKFKKSYKCYVCIFICFAVKAIHLEIVTNCSTDAFLGALKRFISRWGKPHDIFSDNGTNFVGANNELKKILQNLFIKEGKETIENFIASEGIVWHLNPPATPHFGGLWEAGIKYLKSHLKRVIGNTILTYEEFVSLVTQVESVLNSRPLTKISSDPNDSILTPAHFLVGTSLTALPEPDLTNTPINRLNRWQLVQKLTQTFWKKWSNDYLNRLQSRVKWQRDEQQFKEKELVLDKDFSKLLNWNLAKIIKVHPAARGLLTTDHVILNHGQVTWMTPELAPLSPNYHTTPTARRNRRQTAGEIARHTTQATGRPISHFTVARRLHGGGLFARRPVRCVPLTPAHAFSVVPGTPELKRQ
ncbi:integrase catalytic domain-containing protein [Trichonephila clavipes]|nr:integrase catalytic domain-containing protein [Trichonephila clavipes]